MMSTRNEITRRQVLSTGAQAATGVAAVSAFGAITPAFASNEFRIGILSIDTSHPIHFTKYINKSGKDFGCKIVAAFPGGSPDIPASIDRIEKHTAIMRDEMGVKIAKNIDELLEQVDGVLVESNDGRPRLEHMKKVIKAKKPSFMDKPMAASLKDITEIFRLAEEHNVPCWSSSSLRYGQGVAELKNNAEQGAIIGCDAFSPCSLEEHHPDIYWYGIHGVEILFTIMGRGCTSVRRVQTKDTEFVVGIWNDGRIGTYRGTRTGKHDYGARVFCEKNTINCGGFAGYEPLVDRVITFFKTGTIPVRHEDTIEIYAFMSAADVSKKRDGAAVTIESVIREAKE